MGNTGGNGTSTEEIVVAAPKQKDIDDTNKIIQLNFFSDVDEVDIRKTKWLLGKYVGMMDIIQNYEFALEQIENGMSAYELLSAEGAVAKRESGHELTADIKANAVIMKDKRHANYELYVFISNNVRFAINNLKDLHEGVATEAAFPGRQEIFESSRIHGKRISQGRSRNCSY